MKISLSILSIVFLIQAIIASGMLVDDVPSALNDIGVWDYYPLDGDAYSVTSYGAAATSQNVSMRNWRNVIDRFGKENTAIASDGDGAFTISAFESLFEGSYVLNNGGDLSGRQGVYWYSYSSDGRQIHDSFIPYPAVIQDGSEVDASYAFWLNAFILPTNGIATIFKRSVRNEDYHGRSVDPQ